MQVKWLKNPDDLRDAFGIREEVFVREQKFIEEFDAIDAKAGNPSPRDAFLKTPVIPAAGGWAASPYCAPIAGGTLERCCCGKWRTSHACWAAASRYSARKAAPKAFMKRAAMRFAPNRISRNTANTC